MLSNIWFTSDLHLGHKGAASHRGFTSVVEHDWTIISNLNSVVRKRDKLFILGDVCWNNKSLLLLNDIPGIKELIIGNHDTLSTNEYLKYFTKVHGFRKYDKFWLSHCPIHPQELIRGRGNIHGHIHTGGMTGNLGHPYFNVNVDMNNMCPVNLDTIISFYS
jgi:calcineurin-like phosphoesterase family protein